MGGPNMSSPSPRWADDGDLAGEIELYGDLVVAASEAEDALTTDEIDVALGLEEADPE